MPETGCYTQKASPEEACMIVRMRRFAFLFLAAAAVVPLQAGSVSRQSAEDFSQKLAVIQRQGQSDDRAGTRRTRLTEDELNSWFLYRAQPVLPAGVSQPQVTIIGEGQVAGQATIDLDAVAKRRSSSASPFDPLSLIGGQVPVSVSGILHTRDGKARFEVQRAEMSGIPVPVTVLQEALTYYSRSDERPQGVRLDDIFTLPANIRQIEVGQGQAVVVQ
jgi:hypothetical protein